MEHATRVSQSEEYSRWCTELLFWWGHDVQGWRLPATQAGDRARVIEALLSFKDLQVPKNRAELVANYKKHTEQTFQGSGEHTPDDPGEASGEEDVLPDYSESEASAGDEEEPPRKKTKSSPAKSATSAPKQSGCCPHCLSPDEPVGFCTNVKCLLRTDLEYDHPQNVDIRKSRGTVTHTAAEAVRPMSRRDREFERLALAEPPFPLFLDRGTFSVQQAIDTLAKAYMAPAYESPSPALIKLVQSGKLTSLGFASPRTIDEVEAGRGGESITTTIGIAGNSTVRASDTIRAPQLRDSRAFFETLVGVVFPALIEQPAALIDWCALAKTVIELDKERGWEAARAYMQRLLSSRVTQRLPCADYDRSAIDSVVLSAGAASNFSHAQSQPPRGGGGRDRALSY